MTKGRSFSTISLTTFGPRETMRPIGQSCIVSWWPAVSRALADLANKAGQVDLFDDDLGVLRAPSSNGGGRSILNMPDVFYGIRFW